MVVFVLGVHANLLAVGAHALELHLAVDEGEQGIIGAAAHVGAGMDLGAALLDQDVAGQHELTIGALDTQALGLGITAVLGGAHTFFVGEELQTNVQHISVPSFL